MITKGVKYADFIELYLIDQMGEVWKTYSNLIKEMLND